MLKTPLGKHGVAVLDQVDRLTNINLYVPYMDDTCTKPGGMGGRNS